MKFDYCQDGIGEKEEYFIYLNGMRAESYIIKKLKISFDEYHQIIQEYNGKVYATSNNSYYYSIFYKREDVKNAIQYLERILLISVLLE